MPCGERGGAGSKPAGHPISGRGVVVAHLPWEQVYAGSNPAAQTMGGDLGSGWSPKPASEVRFLGRPQPCVESAPRGGELVPKTRVTFGSGVRFLRSPPALWRRGACRFGTPARYAGERTRSESSTLSVSSEWASPGERW